MRTVDQIIDSIKLELASSNSPLSNFSKFSNLYVLFRTVAKAILEVEAYVEEESDNKYISKLSGADLDLKAAEYGIERDSNGIKAVGSVLVSSSFSAAVPVNTVLTDLNSDNQFVLLTNTIADPNEKTVLVQSVEPKFVALPAGTRLYSSLYPNVTFVVGSFRDVVTSAPQGDLIGGAYVEEDESVRQRVLARINSSYISTEQGVISAVLNQVDVNKVYLRNNYPITGYMSLFVDSDDELTKQAVENVLDTVIAAGTNYYVYPIKKVPYDFYIELSVSLSTSAQNVDTEVRNRISSYINSLNLGDTLRQSSLLGLLYSTSGVVEARVISPDNDIELASDQLLSINNIYITITNV